VEITVKITPLDIQQQQFKGKIFGGLDPEDVDAFLQTVSQEMENLNRENAELKETIRRNADAMAEMSSRESQLRETMLAAQRITEEMKSNSQKEATLTISEAELKAEKILADADLKLAQLNSQIQDLRREKLQFEMALKSLLDTHYKMLSLNEE
jgi:cell division initiation protein